MLIILQLLTLLAGDFLIDITTDFQRLKGITFAIINSAIMGVTPILLNATILMIHRITLRPYAKRAKDPGENH